MTHFRRHPSRFRFLPPALTGREAAFLLLLLSAAVWGGAGLFREKTRKASPVPDSLYRDMAAACPDRGFVFPPAAVRGAGRQMPGSVRESFPLFTAEEMIDPNRASLEELSRLPGIGPELAAEIADCRRRRPFSGPEDLLRVKGIGEKRLEAIRSRLIFP